MYTLYRDKKVKNLNIRLSEEEFDKLTAVFNSRTEDMKAQHRNMAEFVRYILKTFVLLQRNKMYPCNYYQNNNGMF